MPANGFKVKSFDGKTRSKFRARPDQRDIMSKRFAWLHGVLWGFIV